MHHSHLWTEDNTPEIRAHSLAKHRALRGYLGRYVKAYTQALMIERLSLTVVDGFAGGNLYFDEETGEERPGSPGIILEALRNAAMEAQNRRTKPFKLRDKYIFIEKDRGAYQSLRQTLELSEHRSRLDSEILLFNDEFANRLPWAITAIKKWSRSGRSLFILDQCGYKDVPFQLIAHIFRELPNAEVILTFAVDFLLNYLNPESRTEKLQLATGINFSVLKQLDRSHPAWKLAVQKALSDDIVLKTNSKFFTPFFFRSIESHRDLWLVHLSQHVKARDEMGEQHWDTQTPASHHGKSGLDMLGFDPAKAAESQQSRLPSFDFDQLALNDSIATLCEDVPRRLRDAYGPVEFLTLFSRIANETPATIRIFKQSLQELLHRKEVVIKDKHGFMSRRSGVQEPDDLILIPSFKTFFLPMEF